MCSTGFCFMMVSVSIITEQLCKQKLEDGWKSAESEKKSMLAFHERPVLEGEGKENTAAGHSTFCEDSNLNNNVWDSGRAENESHAPRDGEWYFGQMEQMPPKKKHRRSFSIPGGTKYECGPELLRQVQHSQSALSMAILRPVAVRPHVVMGLQDTSVIAASPACEVVLKSSSLSTNPFSSSGSCSGFYRRPTCNFLGADKPLNEICRSRLANAVGRASGSEATFQFSVGHDADVWQSMQGTTVVDKNSFSLPDVSRNRVEPSAPSSASTATSNSDCGNSCQGSSVTKPHPLQALERKTGLKRRRDEDRPKLDFNKMIETAYEPEFFSYSISQQFGCKGCLKEGAGSSSVSQTPNTVESSSPCLLLESNNPCRTSPASPFVSLHHHFLAEGLDSGAAGDDETTRFINTNTATNYSNQSADNWVNVRHEDSISGGTHALKDDRVLGSEFDLDLIENN